MDENATVLGAAEEIRLARAIEAGLFAGERLADGGCSSASAGELEALQQAGRQAWQQFLLANLRLVQSVVNQHSSRAIGASDELFQEGFLGLAEALLRWDHAAGFRFSTYAMQWIRRRVTNASVEQRVPGSARTALRARAVRGLADELGGRLRRDASDAELAELVGRSERWVSRMRQLRPLQSLEPEALTESPWIRAEPAPDVLRLLPVLPPTEQQIVRVRFGLDGGAARPQRAAAAELGISLSTLRRHETRALRRLRSHLLAQQAA